MIESKSPDYMLERFSEEYFVFANVLKNNTLPDVRVKVRYATLRVLLFRFEHRTFVQSYKYLQSKAYTFTNVRTSEIQRLNLFKLDVFFRVPTGNNAIRYF